MCSDCCLACTPGLSGCLIGLQLEFAEVVLHVYAAYVLLGRLSASGADSASPNAGGDSWVIVASDGLFEDEVRGGGGGLENQAAVDMCLAAGDSKSAEELAQDLAAAAVQAGSTDDVTVVILKLNT